MSSSPRHARPPGPLWAWICAVLATIAVACLVMAVLTVRVGGPVAPAPVAADPAPVAPRKPAEPREPAGSADQVTPPVGLRIPAVDVAAKVTRLGLEEDRTVEVPDDPADTGWYRLGPRPGQPGSAVILGHVDSMEGPAVFYRLRDLVPGDRVHVDSADGSTSIFRVVRLATYPNEEFPARQVYAAGGSDRVLNLVTCGGKYDPASGYQANVVVYTRWVSEI